MKYKPILAKDSERLVVINEDDGKHKRYLLQAVAIAAFIAVSIVVMMVIAYYEWTH